MFSIRAGQPRVTGVRQETSVFQRQGGLPFAGTDRFTGRPVGSTRFGMGFRASEALVREIEQLFAPLEATSQANSIPVTLFDELIPALKLSPFRIASLGSHIQIPPESYHSDKVWISDLLTLALVCFLRTRENAGDPVPNSSSYVALQVKNHYPVLSEHLDNPDHLPIVRPLIAQAMHEYITKTFGSAGNSELTRARVELLNYMLEQLTPENLPVLQQAVLTRSSSD